MIIRALLASTAGLLTLPAQAQVTTDSGTIDTARIERFFNQPGYSPYAGRNFPSVPLWGEQHLHTSWSPDAFGGGTRVGPDEALQYAKGAEITSSTGQDDAGSPPDPPDAGRFRDRGHRSGREKLDQRAESGDLDVRRQATWGMPACNRKMPTNVLVELITSFTNPAEQTC